MSADTRTEIAEAIRNWPFWLVLGWSDIKRRYARTMLGPWWSVINALVFVGAVGFVYAALLQANLDEILPHLAIGYFVWTFMTSVINDATTVLHTQGTVIKTSSIRPISFVFRMVARNFLVFSHNLVLLVFLSLYYSANLAMLAVTIPMIGILVIFLTSTAVIVAITCTRFRDIEQLIASGLMILFFITPVLWKPEMLRERATAIVDWNIFYHLIEIIRRPILGEWPTTLNFVVAVGSALLSLALAAILLDYSRKRLAFWF